MLNWCKLKLLHPCWCGSQSDGCCRIQVKPDDVVLGVAGFQSVMVGHERQERKEVMMQEGVLLDGVSRNQEEQSRLVFR